jgi:epoxyqueuosine reductase
VDPPSITVLRECAVAAGLAALGVAPAGPMLRARRALVDRKAAGLNDTMAFTYNNPERSTDPRRSFPWAESLVVGAYPYAGTEGAGTSGVEGGRTSAVKGQQDAEWTVRVGHGRVARYAQHDTYAQLHQGLSAVADILRGAGFRATVVADQNHLVDREAAWLAGLGWFGKNANLLVPGFGSWVVLGSVVTSAPLTPADAPVADGCNRCRRCIDACPTRAIIAPGVVDARRCLAWLVQAPGDIPVEFRTALGDRIYGCDDCQEVCPPSRPDPSRAEPSRGADESGESALDDVDLVELLDSSDAELLARFGRWYLAGRDPRWLRRNALVALGNVGDVTDPEVRRVVLAAARGDDLVLGSHARWSCARLGLDPGLDPEHR